MYLKPVSRGRRPRLTDKAARTGDGVPRGDKADEALEPLLEKLIAGQRALYAEGRRALLVVLQGRDAAGKDGLIRSVFGPLNSQGCVVNTFKRPSERELSHDYLWRVHRVVPPRGTIGVFNRSHYEDVLVVRVHNLVPRDVWRRRYDQINQFEKMLADEGVTILKFCLHISRKEQKERLLERLRDPTKNWKFQVGDLEERKRWSDYTRAYQEMLARTSTPWAPWFVVPADRKPTRDLLVAEVLVETLKRMRPRYPVADPEVLRIARKWEREVS
jgi:PPK2 family polyphosphate:nucleotide phosphotransferase